MCVNTSKRLICLSQALEQCGTSVNTLEVFKLAACVKYAKVRLTRQPKVYPSSASES